MRFLSAEKLPRPLRWLYPGLGFKRWYGLLLAGIGLISLGALIFFNLFAYDLVALVGQQNSPWVGLGFALLGLLLVMWAVRGMVRRVARTFLPAQEDTLVDLLLSQRRRGTWRLVALGGGTGLSSLLRGLKVHSDNISAIVTVSDDGGSSGRLREDLGIPAPGDVRNCLVALADSEPLMTRLFDHRFEGHTGDLAGHSFGNLLIAALAEIDGDFVQALRDSSRILAVRGEVLPPTLQPVVLCARLNSGEHVRGESAIARAGNIDYVYLDPAGPPATPEALQALEQAEMVIIGPGSVYTSLIPNLLVPELSQTIAELRVPRLYVCNVMTQPGETDGFSAADHVRALLQHVERPPFDYVLLNTRQPSPEVAARYRAEGAEFVAPDEREIARLGFMPLCRDLIAEGNWARHDPLKLARAITEVVAEHR